MRALALITLLLPGAVLAAGSDDDTPPVPSPTTQSCDKGLIWDADTRNCVEPTESSLRDAIRMRAVRELAYAGRIDDAIAVLDTVDDPNGGQVLTYRGFTARKSGDMAGAMLWYAAALDADPGNLLARSYMGQALAEQGKTDQARAQLSEIRARGGRGTWPEVALRMAIRSGRGFAY